MVKKIFEHINGAEMDKKSILMKIFSITILIIVVSFSGLSAQKVQANDVSANVREHLLMDFGWRFAFGHAYDAQRDFNNATGYFSYFAKAGFGDGPASKSFDDRAWRLLDLPHDWAVELAFSPNAGYSHGYKTVGRNFPETSIGWYRKTFTIPESDLGKRIGIQFDGVFRNSIVWVNGFYLGQEHSGYSSFEYDITDYLNYGGENVVAVRVDATMEEGWFYEGAGIYRHVWLNKTSPLHVARYGTFVSSKLENNSAIITARATIENKSAADAAFDVQQEIIDAEGKTIAANRLSNLKLGHSDSKEFFCGMKVTAPNLWSIENPYMYKLITMVTSNNILVDKYETPFGIRSIRFNAKEGFFLNGKHVLLKGTNEHQDHAGVGTAIPDALQEFRIRRLKEMGSNAIRCSHNPPTPEFLDACDRLGMLVTDENRLMGSNKEHLGLLKNMILRDRNHPCVFVWSIGNEEWAIEGNVTGERIASTMQSFVNRLDSTRSVTYAHSGWGDRGINMVQEVMGFNYIFNGDIDKQHERKPEQPALGTEETTSRSTRGVYEDDSKNAHMKATDRKPGGHSLEEGFKFYAARPWLAGLFYWTGFDYRGEPNPYGWPQVASQSGILDLCGFPKDMFYYLKSWWTEKPVLHIFPHWSWGNESGKKINVWAYSNCDEVELFINGKSLGRKVMPHNSHLEWNVSYEPGTLSATGYKNGEEIISEKVETTGAASSIKLSADRDVINADGEDVSVVTVQANDSHNRLVPTSQNEITFSLKGPGKIIGIGNGDPSSHEKDRFIEGVKQVYITGLKAKTLEAKENYPETEIEFDDSNWKPILNDEGNYNVKAIGELKNMVIRSTFELADLTSGATVTLWPKSLGEEQSVYVNGRLIAKEIKRSDPVVGYKLDNSILRNGKNVYALVGTPLVPRFQYDNLNTDPGIIGVTSPAEQWHRKLFNGLAQVIIQSAKEPGEIILEAKSPNMESGIIKIQAEKTTLRPSVK